MNQKKITKTCLYCNNIFETTKDTRVYCSQECQHKHKHMLAYKDFLKNNEKYCVGNYTPKRFKDFFLLEQNGLCAICNNPPEHNGKPLVFVLDHIDGNAANNKRENLRLICPNCDSQLDTFKSKNKTSQRRNYWRDYTIKKIISEKCS